MRTSNIFCLLSVCALTLLAQLPVASGCGRGAVYLQNNQYKQLLIAISDNVPEDLNLLDRIKEVFTAASWRLFQATKNRAYFGPITVLVPKSWSHNSSLYQPVTKETFDTSDIVIDQPDQSVDEPHKPFTIKSTPCGELGSHMVMTPDYLINTTIGSQYGPYDKVIVHEWGHLRYGLYDEYPTGSDGIHFYAASSGDYEATRCSSAIEGTMYNVKTGGACASVNGQPEEDCRFMENDLSGTKYGSLMYKQYLDQISEFCDNDPSKPETSHNAEAPNDQNRMCGGRSAWEILRAHGDFANGNLPVGVDEYSDPRFTFVQTTSNKRTVLVLDVSGSMYGDRILRQHQGCSNYIASVVNDGEEIGLVQFSSSATTLAGMTVVTQATRSELIQKLPTVAGGGTSIGAGIRQGITVMENGGGTDGGSMIVMSDGGENSYPMITDVWDELMNSNITVHTIAFTSAADSRLDTLAQATAGLAFLYSDSDTSNALNEAFEAIGKLNQDTQVRSYTLASEAKELTGQQIYENFAIIDSGLGKDTEFLFDYGSAVYVSLTDPDNVTYTDAGSTECTKDTTYKTTRCVFPGQSAVGRWEYRVTGASGSATQRFSVTVKSKPSSNTEHPIIAHAFWALHEMDLIVPGAEIQRLFASVSKGYVAVLNAVVTAEVELPVGPPKQLTLLDNGAGADLTKDDGIYSGYFTEIVGNGRYNVKVTANSSPVTMVSPQHIVGVGAARRSKGRQRRSTATPSGDFKRIASGGSFSIKHYPPSTVPSKLYPPGQILNLRVKDVIQSNASAVLVWTATGNQLDSGTASEYQIRMGRSYNLTDGSDFILLTSDDVISGSLQSPKPAREDEEFEIKVPGSDGGAYFFAVIARDTDGRDVSSPLSNVVSITLTQWNSQATTEVVGSVSTGTSQDAMELIFILVSTAMKMGGQETYTNYVVIDSTLGKDTEFLFYYASGADVSLTDPDNIMYTEAGSRECIRVNAFQINCLFPGISAVGRWEYSVTSTATSSQWVHIFVQSKSSSSTDYPIIAQTLWAPGPRIPRLYAYVSKGLVAVLGADVTAEVELPARPPATLTLHDNGAGADLTKDDGIYSAYFTDFSTEDVQYNVKVTVNSKPAVMVCHVHIVGVGAVRWNPGGQQRSTATLSGYLQRTASGGAFNIPNYAASASGKFYAPGQILNMHVDSVSEANGTVSLSWTATGAELDTGTASMYAVRMGRAYNLSEGTDFVLITQDDVTQGDLSAPRPSGEVEKFVIKIPNSDGGAYFFGVLAYDTDGRNVSSPLSNVVSATLTAWDPHPESSGSDWGLIIGVVVGAVVLMLLIIVLVLLIISKRIVMQSCGVTSSKMAVYDRTTSEKMETIRTAQGEDNQSYDVTE